MQPHLCTWNLLYLRANRKSFCINRRRCIRFLQNPCALINNWGDCLIVTMPFGCTCLTESLTSFWLNLWQNQCNSVKFVCFMAWTSFISNVYMFLMRFKSGLWKSLSKTFIPDFVFFKLGVAKDVWPQNFPPGLFLVHVIGNKLQLSLKVPLLEQFQFL